MNKIMSPSVSALIQTDRTIVKDMAQRFAVLTERTASVGSFSPSIKGWKGLAESQWMSGQQMTEFPWEDRKLWNAM